MDLEIESIEERLSRVSTKIQTALDEDRLLLMRIDRVTDHCTRVLKWMESSSDAASVPEDQISRESSDTDTTDQISRDSSTTDTTTETDSSLRPFETVVSPSSEESVLEPLELFPSVSPRRQGWSSSSGSSSSNTPQREFIRNITNLREERLRTIMGDMQERMQRRDSV
jgi:hypothetical protein